MLTTYASDPASKFRQALAFTLLKMKCPDPNKDYNDGSPLQYALTVYQHAQTKQERDAARQVIDWLLSRGGDLNYPGVAGLTPMHDAVNELSGSYVQFLLSKGANPNAKAGPGRYAGQTPLAFAYRIQKAAHKNRSKNPNYVPDRYERVIQLLKEAKAHE